MVKFYCDICGKEITDWSKVSEFKVKKRVHSFHESWWKNLTIHTDCWEDLSDIIEKQRADDA